MRSFTDFSTSAPGFASCSAAMIGMTARRTAACSSPGIPGEEHAAVLRAVVPIIAAEQLANPGADVEKAVRDLIDGSYAKAAIK